LCMALAVIAFGGSVAFTSANAAKRLIGVVVAQSGAALGAIALGLPPAAAIAMLAAMLATLAIGAAISVRMQEDYGAIETPDVNAADRDSEIADDAS
ncbi:MAG: hypothetical protein ABW199_00245, partial [Caulobacterales bacterium]